MLSMGKTAHEGMVRKYWSTSQEARTLVYQPSGWDQGLLPLGRDLVTWTQSPFGVQNYVYTASNHPTLLHVLIDTMFGAR